MNLGTSAEQQELRDAVRRFLADRAPLPRVRELMDTGSGADPAVWQQASEQLGLPGIAIAEEHGGAGFTFAEQAIVLEETGAALYGGPYLASAVLAATALTASEDKAAMADLLPGLAAGTTIGTLAFTEDDGSWDPGTGQLAAVRPGTGRPGTGRPGTGRRRRRLAARRPQELRSRRSHRGPDPGHRPDRRGPEPVRRRRSRRRADPDRAAHPRPDQEAGPAGVRRGARTAGRHRRRAGPALAHTLDVAAIALAAEQLGGAQRALDMAVEYAKTRHQFGRAIGSFQAIKHRCADLLLEVESLRSAVGFAAAAVADGSPEVPAVASLIKAYASDTFFHVAGENIQIHGGIGFTWEHDAHLYFKRAAASQLFLGDAAYHRERLANRIGL